VEVADAVLAQVLALFGGKFYTKLAGFISLGIVLSPAVGAAPMSLSTIIVAINTRLIKVEK